MTRRFAVGDCVRVPDGRVGRVREVEANEFRVRVQRRTSKTHQFVQLRAGELARVDCPRGWMSPGGYRRYLTATLAKLRERQAAAKTRGAGVLPNEKSPLTGGRRATGVAAAARDRSATE